jgi:hypothetical protein
MINNTRIIIFLGLIPLQYAVPFHAINEIYCFETEPYSLNIFDVWTE